MLVHYFRKCDADMRVPPSTINSKESIEEGDDHLSFVGHSEMLSRFDIFGDGFQFKDSHESEVLRDFTKCDQC